MESEITTTISVTPIMAYFGAWLSTCALFWALFSRGETILSQDVKVSAKNMLKGESSVTGRVETWPQQFSELFDSTFGKKHVSWKCFWRSSVSSLLALTILLMCCVAFSSSFARYLLDPVGSFPLATLAATYWLGIVFNLLPDYLSLLETRYIVKEMSKENSLLGIILLLCSDLFYTAAIFYIWVLVYVFVTALVETGEFIEAIEIVREWIKLMREWPVAATDPVFLAMIGVFLYSTFFTSFWVWLYALSNFVVRLASLTDRIWSVFTYCVDIDNKPILSLGTISIVLITLGYLVAAPFVLMS